MRVGLGVVGDAEGDGVVVGRGFEVTVLGRAEDAVLDAVGVERADEVASSVVSCGRPCRARSRRVV